MRGNLAATRLKELREARGWSREELAEKLELSVSAVTNMELGRRKIYANELEFICEAFGIDMNQYFGLESNKVKQEITLEESEILDAFRKLPNSKRRIIKRFMIDWINDVKQIPIATYSEIPYFDDAASMGTGNYVQNAVMEKIEVPSDQVPPGTDFAIRVVGDSMEPTFHSGDKLYIHKTDMLEPGEIGVFNIEGEQFVKEFQPDGLISHNKAYAPIKVKTRDFYIQGKVLGKIEEPRS